MTPRALNILRILADPIWLEEEHAEGAPDLVCEGGVCWFGAERVRRSTVDHLIRCVAVADVSDEGKGLERYAINCTGRAIARRPELEDEVVAALSKGRGSFTIVDDHLVEMSS